MQGKAPLGRGLSVLVVGNAAAFSHEDALELLREEVGMKLDRRCVATLIGILGTAPFAV